MSQASISDLENDLYPSSTYTLKLSEYYGVNPHWLETGKGKKEISSADPATAQIMEIYQGLDEPLKELARSHLEMLKRLQESQK